jgi:hypothetical protein
MFSRNLLLGTVKGLSLIFAYIMVDPLHHEISDTFGSALIYHPMAVWLTLFSLVWANTDSIHAGLMVIVAYEVIKCIWTHLKPEKPEIVKIRKLIHRLNRKAPLSRSDIEFLNEVTPDSVKVMTNQF